MSERSMKRLMKGAAWLTVASLISKILSAVYRVPFQNMVGDVGFYIFQQVYPIYGIAMTLALGGFPVVISKMLAEAEGDLRRQQIIMRAVFRMLRIVSIAIFVFLFLFADIIAMMMGDVALSELIRVISFVFLLMPYLAFMRGFFQSTGEMIPTAISQTIEQIIRVVIILLGAGLALNMGLDLYDAGAMAMSGAIFGGVSGIFVLRHFYNKRLASGQGLQPAVFTEKQEKV
ncbi:oligosaccharide flippase family protein, partial [Listeria booriae]